jgi:hypothetical protein
MPGVGRRCMCLCGEVFFQDDDSSNPHVSIPVQPVYLFLLLDPSVGVGVGICGQAGARVCQESPVLQAVPGPLSLASAAPGHLSRFL